jgi:GNAT superfamily N-acetyltransferase
MTSYKWYMSELNIEVYRDLHKDEIASLILTIQKDEFGIPITLNMQPDLGEIPKYYQVDNGNFWIAKMNKKVIGTIALLDIGNNKGALRKMFVAKEYRGKEFGVGQSLLNNLIDWARQKQMVEILLGTTEKFVAAQRFYEKNGFVEIQKNDLPKEFPIMDVDVKFYSFLVPGIFQDNRKL